MTLKDLGSPSWTGVSKYGVDIHFEYGTFSLDGDEAVLVKHWVEGRSDISGLSVSFSNMLGDSNVSVEFDAELSYCVVPFNCFSIDTDWIDVCGFFLSSNNTTIVFPELMVILQSLNQVMVKSSLCWIFRVAKCLLMLECKNIVSSANKFVRVPDEFYTVDQVNGYVLVYHF